MAILHHKQCEKRQRHRAKTANIPCRFCHPPCRFLPFLPPITPNVKLPNSANPLQFSLRAQSAAKTIAKSGKNGNVHHPSQHCGREFSRPPERKINMMTNCSVPSATVIPVLVYEDVEKASGWLCAAFGFRERLRIGNHRAQLVIGAGAVMVSERHTSLDASLPDATESQSSGMGELSHSVHVRVEDVDQHCERARAHGARILHPPADYPYGERQYTAEDPGDHRWTFSESIADVAPEAWGATVGELE